MRKVIYIFTSSVQCDFASLGALFEAFPFHADLHAFTGKHVVMLTCKILSAVLS